jgi:hypothetical protein
MAKIVISMAFVTIMIPGITLTDHVNSHYRKFRLSICSGRCKSNREKTTTSPPSNQAS